MATIEAALKVQERLQAASAEYQRLQAELAAAVEARQKLDAQLSENELVKKEFTSLTPNNTVYKLVGPVLVPQDQAEAKGNVDKRLDFIRSDIKRVEAQLKEIGDKSEKKKLEIVEGQTALQQLEVELQKSGALPAAA
ncbi:prefoldin subunit 6 [Phanerochaete sordida]|uniref:Prefoldin subunit 6 n=1 Tax=Phanerochaete sordida TaxID=48140 RepID=A0A9P3G592_9APHY|nr:prefoldin subunit 6 [Phanerochaete sordida]